MRPSRGIRGLTLIRGFCSRIQAANPSKPILGTTQTPLTSYEELVRLGDISEDPHQMEAVKKLQLLYDELLTIDRSLDATEAPGKESSWLASLFSGGAEPKRRSHKITNVKGLYMYGGTGCGKTFIMDLFFEVLPIKRKKRVHFNNFMIDIHKRLHRLKSASKGNSKSVGDSIMEQITNELMDEAYLLCFDEFQVTDIADAMILKSLFESMLAKGAIVVATSNRPPQDLYKNGLQRSLFLPFIQTLNDSTNVHSLMASSRDYRILKSTNQALNTYLCPITEESTKILNSQFKRLSVSITPDIQQIQSQVQSQSGTIPPGSRFSPLNINLNVFGHSLNVPEAVAGRRIARFTFQQLCDEALGAADYIHLAETFRIVFITGVPVMNLDCRNEMRRFINLIDAMYEESVHVIVLAEDVPTKLLRLTEKEKASPHDEVFAFDRTISRLLEMQSESYLAASTVRYPVEAGGTAWLQRHLEQVNSSSAIWKQYNWCRGMDTSMPISCLQVLYSDILTLSKMRAKDDNTPPQDYFIDLDHTADNIRRKLDEATGAESLTPEEFSLLLFHDS